MRALIMAATVAAALTAPQPAHAHFLWLKAEPETSPAVARVYFGEAPEPGEPELVARIAKAKVFADGEPLTVTRAEGCLEAKLPERRPAAIDAVCDYGVVTKRGPAFLLQYAARTQARPEPADSGRGELTEHPRLVWLAEEGGKPSIKALRRGKPLPSASVKVFAGEGDPREVVTDADGRVPLPDGRWTSLLLKVVEQGAGSRDGKDYTEVRHYATLTASEEPVSADEVLRRAHRARASWGPDFPGFTADVAVSIEGETVRGKVDVSPDGAVELDMPAGPAKEWARGQLRSLVMHRGLNGPTELEPGATFLEPEDGHPLGRLIRLADDRMGSAYRIKGDEILEVNRTMQGKRFSNRILANQRNAEGKLLPLAFTVSYWDDATGRLERVETFHDAWTRVGRLDLPRTHLQIASADGKSTVRRVELSGHRLGGETRTASPAGR